MRDIPSSVDTARKRWSEAGIELPDEPLSRENLSRLLMKAASRVEKSAGRLVPTSFDPADPSLTALPRSGVWRWRSLEDALTPYRGGGVMMRLPLFWQLEMPLFDACETSGTFVFVNDRGNMPIGAAALSSASMSVVVTDAKDANDFANFLMLGGHPFPKLWFVIQVSGQLESLSPAITGSESAVVQEVHAVPGVPILYQCAASGGHEHVFHPSEEFAWEEGSSTLITGITDDPLPLVRFDTGLTTEEKGLCECGKPLLGVR